jgi:predicted NUDIX family NTP pyrophosphohydrolase
MPKRSAGLLVYRLNNEGELEVLLVHPGGPFFAKKDEGVWSIPKGEYEEGEDPLAVALREFNEETGNNITAETFIELPNVKLSSGKIISSWAVEQDFDTPFISSNLFEMEWPPRSGKKQSFPETDKAEWFSIPSALCKIFPSQQLLLEALKEKLNL